MIESYTIPAMVHGTPLAAGGADDHCGIPGAFLLEVGISSSYHIAKFWGLTGHPRRVAAAPRRSARAQPSHDAPRTAAASAVPASAAFGAGPVDVQAVITNALKAAGLWKSR